MQAVDGAIFQTLYLVVSCSWLCLCSSINRKYFHFVYCASDDSYHHIGHNSPLRNL